MSDWRGTADAVLARLDATLPKDIDLATRRKAAIAAKPHEFAVTSWGTKVWAKAQRAYLERYGLQPRVIPLAQMESPLERAMRRAGEK